MELLGIAFLGFIFGILVGTHKHHWLNGTLTKKEEEDQIIEDVRKVGERIKLGTMTLEEEIDIAHLERHLNYYEREFLNLCKKENLINKLNK